MRCAEAAGWSGLAVEREPGCCGELEWRVEVPAATDLEAAAQRLMALGYEPRCQAPGLHVLRHPQRHEIVLVTRTLRVQLRVYFHTPEAARTAAAQLLAGDLAACIGDPGAGWSPPTTHREGGSPRSAGGTAREQGPPTRPGQ